ncbi:MAG: ABC transporter substrate-binding protein [Bacillota bacterium]|nr:ABC transporter substrate-binding protein [Bacillota bacterium]
MKKKLLSLCAVAVILLAACSNQSISSQDDHPNSQKVKDSLGKVVWVPKKVNRIAALYAPVGYIITLLGQGNKMVAVPGGLQRDKLLGTIVPSVQHAEVPQEGGKINIEELAKARPDLVFINPESANDASQIKKLDQLHIPYIYVDFHSIKQQQNAIKLIGDLLGEKEKAEKYINYYNKKVSLVENRIKSIPEKKRVRVYHSINEATRTDTPDTISADWLQKAGAINVSVNEKLKMIDNKYFSSIEQILLWNPSVILANEQGVDAYIRNQSQLKNVDAVKNGKVYLLPDGITRWGHPESIEIPLVTIWTAKLLYPSKFHDIDMNTEIKDYYQTFFSLSLKDEQIKQILTGTGMRISKEGTQ